MTGRPRKYQSPEDFDAVVDEYVQAREESGKPITWTGLALALGFANRSSIDEYAEYEGFSYSVKRAKAIVEEAYEQRLAGSNPTGSIFALKNMGWRDKQDLEHTGADGGPIKTENDAVNEVARRLEAMAERKGEE